MSIASDALKVPPHDIDAERAVLGALLMDNSTIYTILEILKSEYFYKNEHQKMYGAILSLYEKQQPVDIITLKSELEKQGTYNEVGGTKYLSGLMDSVPTAAYSEHHAHIIRSHFVKRRLIEISTTIVDKAFDSRIETKMLLDEAERNIFALSQEHVSREFIQLKEILTESFERIEELSRNPGGMRGVPTGIADLDKMLTGFQPSNLVILAARPGVGKTSLALNMALNAALKHNIGVGFFSLEMSKEELVDRLLVSQADIDAWRLKTGNLSQADISALTQAMGELAEAPIFIDDTPGLSILEMRTKARKLKAEHNIQFIIVDYLQLANAGRLMESRVQEVSFVSQGLKNLAREIRVPVLALSQLSRAVEQRGTKRPQLADLRDSGAIEQDADVVMFIYSDEEYDELSDPNKRVMKVSIAKHRNGPVGEVDLMFRGDRVKFYGMENTSAV